MEPIVTPEEMRAVDAAAPEPVDVLIERAGAAVARAAVRLMGGTYGRRVVVIAGKGNNGADGRVAARRLHERGASVSVVAAESAPDVLDPCDLVIDAAYGSGFRGAWQAPDVGDAKVLAVDLPSGVDGLTGAAGPGVLPADVTVTFQAWKPGLLFAPGAALCGTVEVADIGLDVSAAQAHLVGASDVREWLIPRAVDSHKWRSAVAVVAGSAGMTGAAALCAAGAMRAGAGIVHLAAPGLAQDAHLPTEVVRRPLPALGWSADVLGMLDRFRALVLGPGLGRDDSVTTEARRVVVAAQVPLVLDGDGLFAVSWGHDGAAAVLRQRTAPTVVTPHDGEFALMAGSRPDEDRIVAARRLAAATHSVVLLKGPATVVAHPVGRVVVVNTGDERLATAGSGDVLSGIIGALLAQGVSPFKAAAAAAWIHGRAARSGDAVGFVAGDLPALIPDVLHEVVGSS